MLRKRKGKKVKTSVERQGQVESEDRASAEDTKLYAQWNTQKRKIQFISCSATLVFFYIVWLLFVRNPNSPTLYTHKVIETYTHDVVYNKTQHEHELFTQGLFFTSADTLIETTGLYAKSILREFDLRTGETLRLTPLPPHIFGEGCTKIKDIIYVGTYRENKILTYYYANFSQKEAYVLDSEIWGLASDGAERLWVTTGQDFVFEFFVSEFRVKKSIEPVRKIMLSCFGMPLKYVNELEYNVKTGTLWGNVFGLYIVVEFDLKTGRCISIVSLAGIYDVKNHTDIANDVPNGIAIHPSLPRNSIVVTGKRWPHIYKVNLKKLKIRKDIKSWVDIMKEAPTFLQLHT